MFMKYSALKHTGVVIAEAIARETPRTAELSVMRARADSPNELRPLEARLFFSGASVESEAAARHTPGGSSAAPGSVLPAFRARVCDAERSCVRRDVPVRASD
jgi:hypothetical protein